MSTSVISPSAKKSSNHSPWALREKPGRSSGSQSSPSKRRRNSNLLRGRVDVDRGTSNGNGHGTPPLWSVGRGVEMRRAAPPGRPSEVRFGFGQQVWSEGRTVVTARTTKARSSAMCSSLLSDLVIWCAEYRGAAVLEEVLDAGPVHQAHGEI